MVTIIKYKKITIDHAIYTNLFYDETVYYLTVSTNDVINTTNNKIEFTEIIIFFEEYFEIKVQEGSILKYINLQICQYRLGFSVDQTDNITEIVNEWFVTRKFRRFDITFRTDYTYKNETMAALPLAVNALHKVEMEYHGKFGHTFGRIQNIAIMNRLDSCYATYCLENQTVAPTLPGFQGIKCCVQYLDSHPHRTIFYRSNYYDG